ncbi:hypothetical protein MHK_006448 [Candidatus Magnetomorum sp. HK-1]|nr:hypothetical protein MHK_006448 [Candidatus Magnetomorum sp. HK-1]
MVKVVEETTKQTRTKETKDYNNLAMEVKELRDENIMLNKRIEALEEKLERFLAVSK